jgi:polysaccharide export outer membrane protein
MELGMLVRLLSFVSLTILMLGGRALSQNVATPLPDAPPSAGVFTSTQSQHAAPKTADDYETLVGGGDLLRISVFGVKDFDVDARVSARGSISVPLIGDVQVAGLTTDEAQAVIEKRLIDGQFMLHPEVSVFTKEYATQGVSVLGEVQKPGIYPMLGSHGLFDVLSMAGGTTPKSGPTVTISHRSHPNEPVLVKLVDIGQSASANSEILPGDTVLVSKAGIVYVVGDVKNPSGVVIENGSEMTVLKAIAIAGGVNPTAAVNSAKLIRRTSNGPEETSLSLKKIFAAKGTDIKLQPEDIIFVPNSAAKSVGRRGLEAVLQAATGVAIYRTP